jgi:hypothetical protein
MERAQKPLQPKARVVMETRETKNVTAILSLVLLVAIVGIAVLVYLFRDKIFPEQVLKSTQSSSATVATEAEMKATFNQAIQQMLDRQFDDARGEFERLAASPGIKEPLKSWVRMNEGLANTMLGNHEKAAEIFSSINKAGLFSNDQRENALANFLVNAGKDLARPDVVIPGSVTNLYSNQNFEAFGLLCFGMHDWEIGKVNDGGTLLRAFMRCRVAEPEKWIESYKPLVKPYAEDAALLQPIEAVLPKVKDAATAQPLLVKVREARAKVQTGTQMTERLDQIEKALVAAGAK